MCNFKSKKFLPGIMEARRGAEQSGLCTGLLPFLQKCNPSRQEGPVCTALSPYQPCIGCTMWWNALSLSQGKWCRKLQGPEEHQECRRSVSAGPEGLDYDVCGTKRLIPWAEPDSQKEPLKHHITLHSPKQLKAGLRVHSCCLGGRRRLL